jgi:hypothetical protein
MTKAEQFHKNFQSRLDILADRDQEGNCTPAEQYELAMLEALDGFYDDEEDIKNMALAFEKLLHIFSPYIASYADNT